MLVRRIGGAVGGAALLAVAALPGVHAVAAGAGSSPHVVLISVDGLHQSDLTWYVTNHPDSTLARLADAGTEYTAAKTPFPSDSFPGMVGLVTGGDPATTGVYYDDTWNHALLDPAKVAAAGGCSGVAPGVEVQYFEALDLDQTALDAGQGLAGLPGSILQMTGEPPDVINPSVLPVDPSTCRPVYPHQYLQTNTVFEVARSHGLLTAWSDKHPAYEILDGPSGTGVSDFFTPEINSTADPASGDDWTQDNRLTRQYDGYKVQAVLNWIDGLDHSGSSRRGVPAVFGMNFQSVSTAQKLPASDGLTGGYLADGTTPGPLLQGALAFVDQSLGRMVAELRSQGLESSTTVIVSAKHGQSPQDPAALTRIDDGPIIDAVNAAWAADHPTAPPLVSFAVDDDGMLMWLSDRSQTAADFVGSWLMGHDATGNDINGNARTVSSSGLSSVEDGAGAASFMGVAAGDPRVPDVIGIAQVGTVYTGGKHKIAEHGGDNPQDRDVPILVSGLSVPHHRMVSSPVETTQIAPTILSLLGLDPSALLAVQREGTPVLPGL
jgi:type I phosphodiesterase/nucleotide pyrophosphatase